MSGATLNGIPRVDLNVRPRWKRTLSWWAGAQLVSTKAGAAAWRKVVPVERRILKATGGRVRFSVGMPIVVLTSIGARSGQRRQTPLAYFTDGDDVVLIASNYGSDRHPAWYRNLLANPECEVHKGPHGGLFVARETGGADRDRLYAQAADRLNKGWSVYEQRVQGIRAIPVMRLTPAQQ